MLFLCVIWFPMISCIYILDAHGTWLNQGWKNTPLPQPVLKHLNTRMASSPWWMPNTASNTCMKRNPKGLRMKQWSSWPLQIASLSTRQTWSESLVGMWQIFPPSSLILWMVWCHLCDCKFVFGERIAVHRSQRPSFQSSLERFERSMVLHPWSTLRAMFASGWIVAVWCFDSEISSCRATLKIFQDNARKSSSIKVRKGVQTAVNSTEAFVLDSPRNSKVQVQEIMGTSSWVKKKNVTSFWSWENPLTGWPIHVATSHAGPTVEASKVSPWIEFWRVMPSSWVIKIINTINPLVLPFVWDLEEDLLG